MSTLINLFKLLYPFLQEFGLKEVNIKAFIVQNKTISYLMFACLLLFFMFLYALEQAHLRMNYRAVLLKEQSVLKIEIDTRDKQIEQLEILCESRTNNKNSGNDTSNIDESLSELMGHNDEK